MEFPRTGNLLGGLKDKLGFSGNNRNQDDYYEDDYDDYGYENGDYVPRDYGEYGYDDAVDDGYGGPAQSAGSAVHASETAAIRMPQLVTREEAAASAINLGMTADNSQKSNQGRFSDAGSRASQERSYERPMADYADFQSPYQTERAAAPEPAYTERPARAEHAYAERSYAEDRQASGMSDVLSSTGHREPTSSAGLNGLFEPTTSAVRATSTRRALKVVRPLSYQDVEVVARTVKTGDVVVLALRETTDTLSKRVLDFSFGVAAALDARVECIDNQVFAVNTGKALTDDEKMQLRKQGVL